MTIANSNYRLHINITYTTTAGATSAETSINTALSNAGRSDKCVRTNAVVDLLITELTEAEATTLRDDLRPAWSGQARTGGKAAIARSNAP
jgi:hypothetical protein